MGCKHEHTREFVDTYCSEKFRNRDLRLHRESVLFEREMACLPETQPYVIHELKIRSLRESYVYLVYILSRINLSLDIPHVYKQPLRETVRDAILKIYHDLHLLNDTDPGVANVPSTIHKCPGEECRGFLNDDWFCDVCKCTFCEKCHTTVGFNHKCDSDTVKTVKLLKRERNRVRNVTFRFIKLKGVHRCGVHSVTSHFIGGLVK